MCTTDTIVRGVMISSKLEKTTTTTTTETDCQQFKRQKLPKKPSNLFPILFRKKCILFHPLMELMSGGKLRIGTQKDTNYRRPLSFTSNGNHILLSSSVGRARASERRHLCTEMSGNKRTREFPAASLGRWPLAVLKKTKWCERKPIDMQIVHKDHNHL